MAKNIGYAVVGTGPVVERTVLPAFARAADETRLAAIVSTDPGCLLHLQGRVSLE